ncbi:DegT/DnrJ/EryC1/StrS family aminotransferase [Candidatus Collierbacteria bacterium]|nr:DegT/DnrJ/EryC1/StrS family aminotransferase [Candidatus Collierbacteria bacterium]
MIITNSLGSNYSSADLTLAIKLLFQPWKWLKGKETSLLEQTLLAKFVKFRPAEAGRNNDVSIRLFLKGRQAIYEALKILKIGQGDEVIVQAFTCVAVVQPILDLGAIPIYVDVGPKNLNPSLAQIKKSVSPKTKALILQHTLGYLNRENDQIVNWCRNHKIIVIQDLAHALGAEARWLDDYDGYDDNNLLHHPNTLNTLNHPICPDAIILSFSQDKVIDGVSGGALISSLKSHRQSFQSINQLINWSKINITKSLFYPLLTSTIRQTYNIGLGKIIHFVGKELDLLPSSLDAPDKLTSLPNALAALILNQLSKLEKIIVHRRNIALIYDHVIYKRLKLIIALDIKNGSNLRYPVWVGNRDELEKKLTKHGFYLMDHWYDAPVSPKWVDNSRVKYRLGSCRNAENLSLHILNLPTHINIDQNKAKILAELINKYSKRTNYIIKYHKGLAFLQ